MDECESELRTVVHQVIFWAAGKTVHNPHRILSLMIEAISEMNDSLSERDLALPHNCVGRIINVAFERNIINWGRIVAVFAYCAKMSRLKMCDDFYLLNLERDISIALRINVGSWFDRKGGWSGFKNFMSSRNQIKLIDLTMIGVQQFFTMFC